MERFNRQARAYVRFAIAPLALLAIYAGFFLVYKWLHLPAPDHLIRMADRYYMHYGYWMLFLAAFVEGLLFVNWYTPGSSLIVIGVVFGRRHEWSMLNVGGIITAGFLCASIIDYALGLWGWHTVFLRFGMKEPLEKMQDRMEKYGLAMIFSTYFQPNLASLAATSAGIFEEPFRKFLIYSAGAFIFWNTIWGIILYQFGPRLLEFVGMRFILIVLVGWLLVLTFQFARRRQRRKFAQ